MAIANLHVSLISSRVTMNYKIIVSNHAKTFKVACIKVIVCVRKSQNNKISKSLECLSFICTIALFISDISNWI